MKTNDWRPSFGFRTAEKITADQAALSAALYIRQSTQYQLQENRESTARQYALAERLKMFGWPAERILIIDDDLGCSGSGRDDRKGFQRLLNEITCERVGIVMGLEMSRLARNSKDWSDLFEVCAIFGTLIADEDGLYDPTDPNDRLVLGLKGIISEMELYTMKTRLERGRLNKAQRGELFHDVPLGYVLTSQRTPEKDPDEQARTVVQLIFDKFDELGSAHAVFRYLVRENIKLPFRDWDGNLQWRLPGKGTVYGTLQHPLYAGAYGYARRKSYKDKRRRRKGTSPKYLPPDQWKVLIRDKYPAYITWERFVQNLQRLHENNLRKDRTGPVREGSALLAGIIFCGHCKRRLSPNYNGRPSYLCSRHLTLAVSHRCQGVVQCDIIDALVTDRLLQALQPAALELSLKVVTDEILPRQKLGKYQRQKLDRARYESQLAERRYQAVDPDNRLVSRTLEKQWEETLQRLKETEQEYEAVMRETPMTLNDDEREQLVALSRDIPGLWQSENITIKDRKQIVRCLIERVVATIQGDTEIVDVTIHWAGGYVSQHQMNRHVSKYSQLQDYQALQERMIELRRQGKRSPQIAEILNREGFLMARQGREFTATTVAKLLTEAPYRERLRNPQLGPDDWLVEDLARLLEMPVKTLKHWVTRGWARAVQRPFGGVWVLWANDQERRRLQQLWHRQHRQGAQSPPQQLRTPLR